MSRLSQSKDAIREAVEMLGASVQFDHKRNNGHICAELTFNGRKGKIFFGSSPSDMNAYKQARKGAVRKLRELGAVS